MKCDCGKYQSEVQQQYDLLRQSNPPDIPKVNLIEDNLKKMDRIISFLEENIDKLEYKEIWRRCEKINDLTQKLYWHNQD